MARRPSSSNRNSEKPNRDRHGPGCKTPEAIERLALWLVLALLVATVDWSAMGLLIVWAKAQNAGE